MDKDTKILLMAVVIILVALVSFNLSDLTGKAAGGASITVTPSIITFEKNDATKLVTIRVNLGSNSVRNQMFLYDRNGRVGSESVLLCRTSTCKQTSLASSYSYGINRNLIGGSYYFKAIDRLNKEIAQSNTFTVQ